MGRSKSSHQWMQRHVNDEYVKRAQRDGYRSRASYKLLELQERDRFLRPAQVVVDLGAAPGGWSQVAARLTGRKGRVIALDLLEMQSLAGVIFIQGDFSTQPIYQRLRQELAGRPVDVVLSDMAPNVSGLTAVDQPRAMYLCELALAFAEETLAPGGTLVSKVFQGQGFDAFIRQARSLFGKVSTRKPDASRARSREVYMVATGRRLN